MKHNKINCHIVFLDLPSLIFQEFKNTDPKYKNRVRSRISNLKDIKNPNLRRTVLCGSVTPERMAKMSAEVCGGFHPKDPGTVTVGRIVIPAKSWYNITTWRVFLVSPLQYINNVFKGIITDALLFL